MVQSKSQQEEMSFILKTADPLVVEQMKNEGYSYEEIATALREMEEGDYNEDDFDESFEKARVRAENDPRNYSNQSMFATSPNDNMVKWQLELDNILERVEHSLRHDRIEFKAGNLVWTKTLEEGERTLNDFGVNEIMKILSLYLNRNTILSNYDQETINEIVYDFGVEMSNFIFMKYDEIGMNTPEKRKAYPLLVRSLVDVVRNAYQRAWSGGERLSLREARQVQQMETITPTVNVNTGQGGGHERGILNPLRYLRGKYS